MLITMGVSLYSTRLVLNALGSSDYGILNLIAGIIAMLSFLNAAMSTSTQRYLSYHQGTKDFVMQKKVFSNSWVLHIAIGVFVVGLLWALVPFLFGGFLNIPIDRIPTAKVLYYFMSVSVFFTIVSVPFTASLNAHENMLWIALVNIIESFIKLSIAISLFWFIQADRLVTYSVLMAGLCIISFILYASFCLKKYNECSIKNYRIDKTLIKELGGFAGWNLFGSLCWPLRSQGLAVLLNIFFGTIVNAAYGIANQVSSQLSFFSITMLRAINPQIMKSEGMNDRHRMLRLSMMASKFGFFLVASLSIPLIFEMSPILKLWLKDVPDHTVVFCSLCLLMTLTNQLTIGLQSSFQAAGRIKIYQTVVGSIIILNLPIAYVLLKVGLPPSYAIASTVFVEFVASSFRLFLATKQIGLSIRDYFDRVIQKIIIPTLVVIAACWFSVSFFSFDFRFLFTILSTLLLFAVSTYFFGLCTDEKALIHNLINKIRFFILKNDRVM